jgi:lysozyme
MLPTNETNMKQIIATIKDLTSPSLVTYSNKQGEIAIGYNHTLGIYNGQECTLEEAAIWLRTDISALRIAIRNLVDPILNIHQERALISLVHDIGLTIFTKSKLLQFINNKQFVLASNCFLTYNTNKRVVSISVIRRRQIEQNIFNLEV